MKNMFAVVLVVIPQLLCAIDPTDTRMMTSPAISVTQIAFIYAEDLWTADVDGSNVRRLTVDEGIESNPYFSPDGKWIAFGAQYDGNTDVFIVPSSGGVPTRLTWHPGQDAVRGFTPDGKSVLFASQRAVFTGSHAQLFTVPLTGGFPTQLEIPNAYHACYSPDGSMMAYTPLRDEFLQWKHYRGGTMATIWLFSFADKSIVKIPQAQGGSNDTSPQWVGNKIYFRSDRNGEFNVYSYDVSSKEIVQLTDFKDFPVLKMSASSNKLIFEQAGYLYAFDTATKNVTRLKLGIGADLLELRPRLVKGAKYIRWGEISATGARAVFDFRGDIITLPAEKGDARNLTETTGVHEKYPAWSPDGKSIAYFSDAGGEYALHIKPQDGKGATRMVKLTGTGFYAQLKWSPDSKKIAYVDNGRNLYWMEVASGISKKIDADELYTPGPFRDLFGDWSKDSKWIAYTKVMETNFRRVFLYSLDQGKSNPVTDGLSDASEPIFDPAGKYLFFFASTDAGPVINWFDQSNIDMRSTYSIYLATLKRETISPFAKESDEEKGKEEEKAPAKEDPKKKKTEEEPKKEESFRIDVEGLQHRIVSLPVKPGNYQRLDMGKENELLYLVFPPDFSGPALMHKYDIKERKDSEVTAMNGYAVSADGKKMLYVHEEAWYISGAGEKGEKPVPTDLLEVRMDPAAEWPSIVDEAWRVNRDYFYDPGMHGADWPAIKKKYVQFIPHLSCHGDLHRVIQWMGSELVVGHHFQDGADEKPNRPTTVSGGLLGADFQIAGGRYQLKKIYGGLNWNPGLRSPLTEPGVNAKEGDYILAVNGKDLLATEEIYKYFEATAGKIVELTLGPNPNYTASHVEKVVPIEGEWSLRNRAWVEGNLKKVTEATQGRVAYVYVPNTSNEGHEYFKRYFFPQANRKAIIVDERFNGGGSLADYYIDILLRPYQAHWNMRYGKDLKSPSASIQGPKVMIIDETAGSGGDMLPWMFRKFKVGTIVGKRTWGGLVGILGYPEFIDGGSVTAPNVGIWTNEGFIVENVGVEPDIEVEQTPSEVINGNDPQLMKAIEIALKELEKNPPVEPVRPPYPVKVKK